MGVTGLWNVVHPCARPIKIETLNKKRLAVDASIWIYQFLKAVRDKDGNALRNSHVVGFFRRICKLLYLGIKPVFVFDGGAPALKRQTINNRRRRREGRRDDAVKTAGKLLALQMQRMAEEEENRRKDARDKPAPAEEEPLPDELVYAEEIALTAQERQKNRTFKKQDAYHLPNLDADLAQMGQPNDPRIMSLEELQHYANQFQSGEDINVYDFSKIDFDSPFFTSLPASDRYNILNAARLRSRLRMGYSKEQLDVMFPNRMDFSRFQIERVRERNELTQRLMQINNAEGDLTFGSGAMSRIAGERGREYVLVRNDGVEGGWALGVVSNEGKKDQPIDVDAEENATDQEGESDEDIEFEDVPIEGVNRLPKRPQPTHPAADLLRRDMDRRKALYGARRRKAGSTRRGAAAESRDSLFVQSDSEAEDEEWEDVFEDAAGQDAIMVDEDEDLQRAIALSMQQNTVENGGEDDDEDDYREVFAQRRAADANPFANAGGKAIAHVANVRSHEATSKLSALEESDDEDAINFQAALMESRNAKQKQKSPASARIVPAARPDSPSVTARAAGFDGPLPFEKLSLGSSLLGKKKMDKLEQDQAGGFERQLVEPKPKKEEARPLPPWFTGDLDHDMAAQRKVEQEQRERDLKLAQRAAESRQFEFQPRERIRQHQNHEVIDLEAEPEKAQEVIIVDSEPELDPDMSQTQAFPAGLPASKPDHLNEEAVIQPQKEEVALGDVSPHSALPPTQMESGGLNISAADSQAVEHHFEWEASDNEPEETRSPRSPKQVNEPKPGGTESGDSDEEDFEDVVLDAPSSDPHAQESTFLPPTQPVESSTTPELTNPARSEEAIEFEVAEDEDVYSDPEDEELILQMMQEEEEHARFTSSLNQRTVQQNIADYERELKQLRTQQKKDRRDADEVIQTMITECQQLLTLFGLPYITAPMEAEAQCAELVRLGLVDGIVTDDSDVFLFGGTRVYKNVFNQAKFVECYLATDLEAEFGLTRQRLISIAQLLGSDYTEGLPGIGPVTALEILSEFDDLVAFKEWFNAVQQGQRSKDADANSAFRKKFRRNAAKIFLPVSFPNPQVEKAYLEPEVDSDPSEFVWGVPDLQALRAFLMSTIGWSNERVDEILVPVIRDMNRREQEGTQANITAFFGGGVGAGAFAPRRRAEGTSKRLESALHKIGDRAKGNIRRDDDNDKEDDEALLGRRDGSRSRNGKRTKRVTGRSETLGAEEDDENFEEPQKKTRKIATARSKTSAQPHD
ncbi:uncharacterized protein PV09_02019 [Verruconis gallopava]|uniref:PIN domain-like protein n=1 Tax=Verruconis gallopava TaxID=253628 RepID=A0A0D2B7C4_9PEZI|nr:uncharacterized protein PV09_02019 [Verruconis gallopava]KIW07149.1 hypothetical protein PV09_02019 [Verruconis gallopava]